jgi:hypothetical protein
MSVIGRVIISADGAILRRRRPRHRPWPMTRMTRMTRMKRMMRILAGLF